MIKKVYIDSTPSKLSVFVHYESGVVRRFSIGQTAKVHQSWLEGRVEAFSSLPVLPLTVRAFLCDNIGHLLAFPYVGNIIFVID